MALAVRSQKSEVSTHITEYTLLVTGSLVSGGNHLPAAALLRPGASARASNTRYACRRARERHFHLHSRLPTVIMRAPVAAYGLDSEAVGGELPGASRTESGFHRAQFGEGDGKL
jgi:hypothetical protein